MAKISRSERISAQRRKNKILKIAFFVTEGILLLVVIACAVILHLLDGIRVIQIPEESKAVNGTTAVVAEGQTSVAVVDGTTAEDATVEIPTDPLESYPTPFAGDEYTTIVVFGLDGRDDIESLTDSSNSDVIILVSINNETGAVRMVSVYRDTFMKLYQADEGKVKKDEDGKVMKDEDGNEIIVKPIFSKANYPLCEYNIVTAINTLNLNLDLDIDAYVSINWAAAVEIINAFGGVDITLKKAYYEIENINPETGEKVITIDPETGLETSKVPYFNGLITELVENTGVGSTAIPKSEFVDGNVWHADGVQAVAYMRLRKTDSDISRTARQREIIQKIVDKAKAADLGTLLNVWDIIKSSISLSLDQSDVLGLLGNITKYKIEDTKGYPFELYGGGDYTGGMKWMIIPVNVVKNVGLLHEFLYNQTDYKPSKELKEIDDVVREKGLFDEDWNITIETKEY